MTLPIIFPPNKQRAFRGAVAIYDPYRQFIAGASGQSLLDYSGNGNAAQLGSTTGVDTNDPTWASPALTYLTDDYCTAGNVARLGAMSNFSVLAIAKQSSQATAVICGKQNAVSTGGSSVGFRLAFYGSSNQAIFSAFDASGTQQFQLVNLTDVTQYKAVGGVKKNGLKGFCNGAFTAETAAFTYRPDTTNAFILGRYSYTSSGYLNGAIAFLIIADVAWGDAEFQYNYRKIKGMMAARGIAV